MNAQSSVREYILDCIKHKRFEPGDRIDSIRAIAKEVGTNKNVAYRAVTQLVYEGHLRNQFGRGYYVAETSAAQPDRQTVGLLLDVAPGQPTGRWSQLVIDPVQEAMLSCGQAVLILGAAAWASGTPTYIDVREIQARSLNGLLVMGVYDLGFLARLAEVQPNVVVLDMDATNIGLDSVSFDHLASAETMVRLLAAEGMSTVGFVGGPWASLAYGGWQRDYDPCTKDRYDGWRLGVQAMGFEPEKIFSWLSNPAENENDLKKIFKRMLDKGTSHDAVLTERPDLLTKVLEERACKPDDIIFAGWSRKTASVESLRYMRFAALNDFELLAKTGIELLSRRQDEPSRPCIRKMIFPRIVRNGIETVVESSVQETTCHVT
jgi:DNA-binding LacI/PurR family transcriptional regulator